MEVATDTTTRSNQKLHPILQHLRSFARKFLPKIEHAAVPFLYKEDAKPDGKGMHSEDDKVHLDNDIDEMGRSELRKLAKQWKVTQNNRGSIQLREDLKKHLRKQP